MTREICEDCNDFYGDNAAYMCYHCYEYVYFNKYLCMHCVLDNYAKLYIEGHHYIICEKCYPKYFNDEK